MVRVISRKDAKAVINLLRKKQPRTLKDFVVALGKREFETKKLLKGLDSNKVIIKESLSGDEKYWLNETQAVAFLGRDPLQRKRLKHHREKEPGVQLDSDDSAYW
jgi:hypothetical protein